MKGLLIKDFQLMKNQGKILIAILVVIAAFGIIADGNSSFLTAYITIFLALFTTSTISYDEYDSGYLFLFTLPVNRKICVRDSQCPDCLVLWHGSGDSCFSADNSS